MPPRFSSASVAVRDSDAVAAAAAELRRAPFERWDVPGAEWPPREV